MPPKAVRGGRAIRGKGTGRGRGKAPEPDASSDTLQDNDSQPYAKTPFSPPLPSPSKIALPQHISEAATPSPNSSPADIPTETPAPTPIRATNSQKNNGGPSGSSIQTPPSIRGGRGGAKESKFKPKAIRRDVGERVQAEEKEKARLDALAKAKARADAEKARAEARMSRGRGGAARAGRGRGDVMGRGTILGRGAVGIGAAPSGLFGVAPAGLDRRPGAFGSALGARRDTGAGVSSSAGSGGGAGGGGGGGGGGGTSGPSEPRIKTEGGSFYSGGNNGDYERKQFIPDPEYPDEDMTAPRIDIELINLVSSDEDDDEPIIIGTNRINKGKQRASASKGGLKPVRLLRQEHKERVSQVNTESVIKDEPEGDGDMEVDAVNKPSSSRVPAQKDRKFKGVYDDVGTTRIKSEDGVVPPEVPNLSLPTRSLSRGPTPVAGADEPPDFKKRVDELEPSLPVAEEPSSPIEEKKKSKPRTLSKKKDQKPVLQTDEDRAEYERHLEDVAILAHELGGMQTRGRDADGDVTMDDDQTDGLDQKEGRLYLFQFPPVLPKLYNPLNKKPETVEDTQIISSSTHVDLTKDKNIDPNVEVIKTEDDVPPEPKNVRKSVVEEEGWVGKLVVRESGRVELNWGGTNMVLGRGFSTEFLSIGMVVDGSGVGSEGKAMGMGKVMGKFVVVPDWESLT